VKTLTHLERLEAESIDIMREAVAESERPVMFYSIGKDSSVLHSALRDGVVAPLPEPSRSGVVGRQWHPDQLQDLALQVGELGAQHANVVAREDQDVPGGGVGEEAEDLLSGRSVAGALFGVERQVGDADPLHALSQLAFDQGLDEQGQEVDEEEGVDARFVLEEDGATSKTLLS